MLRIAPRSCSNKNIKRHKAQAAGVETEKETVNRIGSTLLTLLKETDRAARSPWPATPIAVAADAAAALAATRPHPKDI